MNRWLLLVVMASSELLFTAAALAEKLPPDVKLIRFLPRTDSECDQLHQKTRGMVCEQVEPGEPLEITSFMPSLGGFDSSGLPVPASRRHAFTVGLTMQSRDRENLPTLSRGKIVEFLNDHYVSVQARVQRDLVDDTLYLNHRTMAVMALYRGLKVSQDFTALVTEAVRDFHGLGLFVNSRAKVTAEQCRTLVLLHKNKIVDPNRPGLRAAPSYELVVIRAVPSPTDRKQLVLHCCTTTEGRRQWHYIRPFELPNRPSECSILANVVFTDFKYANLYPVASLMRNVHVRSRVSVSQEDMDQWAKDNSLTGDALDNLTEAIDALIAGKIKSTLAADN